MQGKLPYGSGATLSMIDPLMRQLMRVTYLDEGHLSNLQHVHKYLFLYRDDHKILKWDFKSGETTQVNFLTYIHCITDHLHMRIYILHFAGITGCSTAERHICDTDTLAPGSSGRG